MTATDQERVCRLLEVLNARATGFWRPDVAELVQTGFASAADMPRSVADGFSSSTQRVPLERVEFGIAKAAAEKSVAVSRADELSTESGSGLWLRAFAATRSVAVALLDADRSLLGVLSVALADDRLTDDEVAGIVRSVARDDLIVDVPGENF